jgi:peptidoglycan/xylan/chitin deacetylase (PgdA/CDA1 family)
MGRAREVPACYRGRIVHGRVAPLHEKVIALTFDDGPNPALTPMILKTLAQYKARATFFVLGQWAQEWPQLIVQEKAAGHAIGSHSYSHANEDVNAAHAKRELERTATVLEQFAGGKPELFRPPYGYLDWSLPKVAAKSGYCVVKWTICSSDAPVDTPAQIVEEVMRRPQSGDIVLLHDGRGHVNTARALPEILRRLSAKGFKFVTVPELLAKWDRARSSSTGLSRKQAPGTSRGRTRAFWKGCLTQIHAAQKTRKAAESAQSANGKASEDMNGRMAASASRDAIMVMIVTRKREKSK